MTNSTASSESITSERTQSPADVAAWNVFIRTGKGDPNSQIVAPHGGVLVLGPDGKLAATIPHNVAIDSTVTDPWVACFGEPITDEQRAIALEGGLNPDDPTTAWGLYSALTHKTEDEKFLYTLGADKSGTILLVGTGTRFEEEIKDRGAVTIPSDGGETQVNTLTLAEVLKKIRTENAPEIEFLVSEIQGEQTAALARFNACRAAQVMANARAAQQLAGIPNTADDRAAKLDEAQRQAALDPAHGVSTDTRRFDVPAPGDHQPATQVPLSVVNPIMAAGTGAHFTTAPDGSPHVAVRDASGKWQRFAGEVGTAWHRFAPAIDRFFNSPHHKREE